MLDLVRAFRLLTGARCYIEVGTFDKGNLAYAARLLAPDATLIDVDIEARPERSARLAEELGPDQILETVVGDSSDEQTLARVREILKGREADAVFIDADHCAHSVFADYAAYAPLVRPGGWVLFHDVYWNGDETTFGTATALAQIDRFSPIHVVFGNDPVHRFLPWLGRQDTIWGGVGILRR
jgi:predicted O-methyltransferase YrrM